MNSKKENCSDFCLDFVQEFGLCYEPTASCMRQKITSQIEHVSKVELSCFYSTSKLQCTMTPLALYCLVAAHVFMHRKKEVRWY